MKNVDISVIVPIYRIEAYLPSCIESLLEQSFTNFELILVDDGSPDNCPQICDDYAETDNRIRVVHKPNGGLLSARKAGLDAANGRYIAFVDGDDWVDPYYLDILFKLAESNNADLTITGHFREFDGKIETIKPKNPGTYDLQAIQGSILPKAIYNGQFCEHGISTYVWNKLFKKSLLQEVLYDVPNEVIMGEDAAITYAYLALSQTITISTIPLYYYRQRHDSIVKSIENPKMEYYRLGLLMNFLYKKLGDVMDMDQLNDQITYYLYSQILVRSGGLICNDDGSLLFNPFLGVTPKSKVVVYSSGSFGQHILSTNKKIDYFGITQWIDMDYHELKIGANAVQPMSSFDKEAFDHLIIATINPTNYELIKAELTLMGIDAGKIVHINTDLVAIRELLSALRFDQDFTYLDYQTQ